jgi:5-methylcytosine-specific restriction protein A
MALGAALQRVLDEYPAAQEERYTGHPLTDFIRHGLPAEVAGIAGRTYKITGSAGQSRWADTPWVAAFEPSVTTSAQRGILRCLSLWRRR